jgi:hypothetical protein
MSIHDESERRLWWFWPWAFASLVLGSIIGLIILVVSLIAVPVGFILPSLRRRQERRLHRRYAVAGRYLKWDEMIKKLHADEGTLIIEVRSPKGAIRLWWTPDDLIESAPVSLDGLEWELSTDQLDQVQQYARECVARYVDVESGRADLAEFPSVEQRPVEGPPAGNVVTLYTWFDEPFLATGDAEKYVFV